MDERMPVGPEDARQQSTAETAEPAGWRESRLRREGTRRWAVTLLALLLVGAGFGLGWAVGSIWYPGGGASGGSTGKSAVQDRAPALSAGEVARATVDSGPLALRDSPDGTRIEGLADGWELKVVSGPVVDAVGGPWYQVEITDTRYGGTVRQGYVAAGNLENR